jgi:hypothetical protein
MVCFQITRVCFQITKVCFQITSEILILQGQIFKSKMEFFQLQAENLNYDCKFLIGLKYVPISESKICPINQLAQKMSIYAMFIDKKFQHQENNF